MANVNIGNLLIQIANFLAQVCDKVYQVLMTPVPIFHCTVFQLIGVIGGATIVITLIVSVIRG